MSKLTKQILEDDLEEVEQEAHGEAKDASAEELLSEEINDVISHRPHWLVRHGVSAVGIILMLLLLGSWFVPYPDKLIVPIHIIAKNSDRTWYGEIVLSKGQLGKVSPGTPVTVEVENYAAAKFGYLYGRVSCISTQPSGDSAVLHVALRKNVYWNYNKVSAFKGAGRGKAKLINRERRLLEKLLRDVIST
jgi:hypothetical protein